MNSAKIEACRPTLPGIPTPDYQTHVEERQASASQLRTCFCARASPLTQQGNEQFYQRIKCSFLSVGGPSESSGSGSDGFIIKPSWRTFTISLLN